MARANKMVIGNIPIEQMDNFFTLDRKVKVESFEATTLKGKPLDPQTGRAMEFYERKFVPAYKNRDRFDTINQTAYAQVYRQREEEEFSRLSLAPNGVSNMAVNLLHSPEEVEYSEVDSTITGFSQMHNETSAVGSDKVYVYENYNFNHNYDKKLPVYKYHDEIVRTIETNQVTIVQGVTGCGKTTQVAQYIIDDYARQNRHCNIVVTQPRRIAAMSIARRVCDERRWPLGTVCGYQVGLDRKTSEDTRLLYCTTGILLQKLINSKDMTDYTHVIIDEVHERDQDTDFLLLLAKKLLRTTSPRVKVVLMSATFESEKFAKYFGHLIRERLELAPILDIEGSMFSVREFYIEDLSELGDMPTFDLNDPGISDETSHICLQLVRHFDEYEKSQQEANKASGELVNKLRGSVLIFLPGFGEIHDLMSRFIPLKESHKLVLVPLHSMLTVDEQNSVFVRPLPQYRKVIFATNVAESSITVPDVAYVVDFCLTKVMTSDPDTNYSSLHLQWTSKANCAQRKGRAGRVANGRVYRLITRRFYHELPDYATPEILRCPLEQLVLQTKLLDIGEPKKVLGVALDPPNIGNIERTILSLKEMGAMLLMSTNSLNSSMSYYPYDGELTALGRVIAKLPVDVRIGKLMVLGHIFGFLRETVIIGASLSLRAFFARPFRSEHEAYKHKFSWARKSFSDCFACLHAYTVWEHYRNNGSFRSAEDEIQWGKQNYVQIRRLKDVADLVKELLNRLDHDGIRCNDDLKDLTDDDEIILKVICAGAFYPNYFIQGTIDEESAIREISGHNPATTVIAKGLPDGQGHLYMSSIQALFQCCDPPRVPKVSFEATRAYIDFERSTSSRILTKFHPAVYVALKMKYLRHNLIVTANETQAHGDVSPPLSKNYFDINAQLGPRQIELPSAEKSGFPIFVTEVLDCGHAWAQYRDMELRHKLDTMNNAIEQAVKSRKVKQLSEAGLISPGTYCIAPFEGLHYRARVEKCDPVHNAHMLNGNAEVFFVDYGNTQIVQIRELFEINTAFLSLPFLAFEVKLCMIQPSPIRCPGGRWNEQAKIAFADMVYNNENLNAEVYSIVHGVVRVTIHEKMHQQAPDRNINQELVLLNFAVYVDESLESNQNHLERERSFRKGSSGLKDFGRPLLSDNSKANHEGYSSRHPYRVQLKNVWSPYEVKFHSLTAAGRLRQVTVQKDGVNSIALHDEPVQMNRLLIAASVSQNSHNGGLSLQDTTLMPAIPGLAALMALLFAQQAELRVDNKKTCYTGVLCGLGWDADTGGPAFPDHDLELTFDARIDQEDIRLVNTVRMHISMTVGADAQIKDLGENTTKRVQNRACELLMNLLRRERPLVEPIYHNRQYEWNLIDSSEMMRVEVANFSNNRAPLPLLSLVMITEKVNQPRLQSSERELKQKHVQLLHKMASESSVNAPEEVRCLLCNITMLAPRGLSVHLATTAHRQAEALLI